jgi:hypothetical protein
MPYVKDSQWDGKNWILLSDIRFSIDNKVYNVPAGFITNFGSIPSVMRPVFNQMGKSLRAFAVHDWIYSQSVDVLEHQRDCDKVLYDLSRADGESWVKAKMINKGLLLGGWTHFKKIKPRIEKVSKSVIKYICKCNGFFAISRKYFKKKKKK